MAGTLQDLTASECLELIRPDGVGRVAFCRPSGPEIFPVDYALDGSDVVFRTAPYTTLGRYVVGAAVAFEVDRIDHDRAIGWSVVVHGTATSIDDPDEVAQLRRIHKPSPWAAGSRSLYVRIGPDRVTGRRVDPQTW